MPVTVPIAAPDIVVRRMHFDIDDETPHYWHSNSPNITHFFMALSMLFPGGEAFFIESVKACEDKVQDPLLRGQVTRFVQQEAHHSAQHRILNDVISRAGLTELYEDVLARQRRRHKLVRRFFSKTSRLAATVGGELFTAALAEQLLSNPRTTEGMDPGVRALWIWHAIEETEHKAVAFDVYRTAGGGHWNRAVWTAVSWLANLFGVIALQLRILSKEHKLFDAGDFLQYLGFMFGKGGLVRGMWPELIASLRRDFHPWQLDNRAAIEKWRNELQAHVVSR